MSLPDCHLDLGCGKFPRNPYARGALCGVDIRPLQASDTFDYRIANLSLQPIPWPDDSFGSVSAFDFIEHAARGLDQFDLRWVEHRVLRLRIELVADREQLVDRDAVERPTVRMRHFAQLALGFRQGHVQDPLAGGDAGHEELHRHGRLARTGHALEQLQPMRREAAGQDDVETGHPRPDGRGQR